MQPRAPGTQASCRDLQCPGPARLRRVSVGSAHVPAQRHRVQQARSRATHRLAAQCTVRRGNTSPNLRYSSEIPEIQTPTAVYTSSAADFIVNTRAKPAPCCLASRATIIHLSTKILTQAHEIGKSNDKKAMQSRSMSAPIVLHDAWCAMEGGGGRDRRAALPRCMALVDPLVHAQLSLRSRLLIFFTSPLLLNLRLEAPPCTANGTDRCFSVPYHPGRHARIIGPHPRPRSNPSLAFSHPAQLRDHPRPPPRGAKQNLRLIEDLDT